MPGDGKGEEIIFSGNRCDLLQSNLCIYVTHSTDSQVHLKFEKVNHHKQLGLNPSISSQWLTMDFSASAKSGRMALWHSGRELEYESKYFALCFSLNFLWFFEQLYWIYYSKRVAEDPSKTYKSECLYVTGR